MKDRIALHFVTNFPDGSFLETTNSRSKVQYVARLNLHRHIHPETWGTELYRSHKENAYEIQKQAGFPQKIAANLRSVTAAIDTSYQGLGNLYDLLRK